MAAALEQEAAQEYYLSWDTPMLGAYYAREFRQIDTEGRITSVPYDPTLPVYTAWDLGHNDTNAIFFWQIAGHEVRFIDYEEGSSIALAAEKPGDPDGWVEIVRSKPYTYCWSKLPVPLSQTPHEVHVAPHDIENHSYSTGKTRYSYARERGFRFTPLPHPGPGGFADGIMAARRLLARSVFDAEKCEHGIDALRDYRRERVENTQTFRDTPLHNWASNAADSFRYAAVWLQAPPEPRVRRPEDTPGTFAYRRKHALRSQRGGRR